MALFYHGIRHEIAKRYTPLDWALSLKVQKIIDLYPVDSLLSDLISQGTPHLVGRLGGSEARFIGQFIKNYPKIVDRTYVKYRLPSDKSLARRRQEIHLNAGFFYDHIKDAEKFVEIYLECLVQTDVLGAWGFAFTWPEVFALGNENLAVVNKEYTSPWVECYSSNKSKTLNTPWSHKLNGKDVLVISPFADSIASQHSNIERVFPEVFFPRFNLQTIRAPMTNGKFAPLNENWFDILENIKNQISNLNFDIALISCGAYSFPLAMHVKKLGKVGIHCGGALQLFFGIMGNRWTNSPEITKFHNPYWIRPSISERPIGHHLIENGCYW